MCTLSVHRTNNAVYSNRCTNVQSVYGKRTRTRARGSKSVTHSPLRPSLSAPVSQPQSVSQSVSQPPSSLRPTFITTPTPTAGHPISLSLVPVQPYRISQSVSSNHASLAHSLTHSLTQAEAGSLHGRGGAERKKFGREVDIYTGCNQLFFSQTFPNSKPDSEDDARILDVVYRLVTSEYMYKNIADETFAEQARPALITHSLTNAQRMNSLTAIPSLITLTHSLPSTPTAAHSVSLVPTQPYRITRMGCLRLRLRLSVFARQSGLIPNVEMLLNAVLVPFFFR